MTLFKAACLFFLSVLFFSCTEKEPNVIIIYIDDMGYGDLSCFGNDQVSTPNIDRLAEKGIRLTNYYSNSPVCSPSRAALLTGQYPASLGINSIFANRKSLDQWNMPYFLSPEIPNLARTLKDNGYATGHFGKWHMGGGRDIGEAPIPYEYGFDKSLVSFEGLGDRLLNIDGGVLHEWSAELGRGNITYVHKYQKTGIYIDSALSFINSAGDQPFYVNLWPNDVHDWHLPEPGSEKAFENITDNPYEQDFFAVLKAMDQQFGRFFDSLDQKGLMENTLIILTSDNGPTDWPRYYDRSTYPEGYDGELYAPGGTSGFRGRKWSLYEGGIRMPFIAYWKGKLPAGAVNHTSIMASIDLFPTICSLLDIPVPSSVEGVDMSRALYNEAHQPERNLYWYYEKPKPHNRAAVRPELAIRSGDWKLVMRKDTTELALFNLEKDPSEHINLLEDYQEKALEMRKQLLNWYNNNQ